MARTVLLAALVLLLLLGWVAWSGLDSLGRAGVATPETPRAPAEAAAPELDVRPSEVRGATEAMRAPMVVEAPTTATVRGRLIDAAGAPLVGAVVRLSSDFAGEGKEPEVPVAPVEGTTGADGRFALTLTPPPEHRFLWSVALRHYEVRSRRWDRLAPGEVVDLGDVVLLRAAVVAGRVVNPEGDARVGESWEVTATVDGLGCGRDVVDPASASFRMTNVTPGRVRVLARSPYGDEAAAWVTVAPAEHAEVDVIVAGEQRSRDLRVALRTAPFHLLRPAEENVRLYGPGHEHGTPFTRFQGSRQPFGRLSRLVFDDLEPGEYTVEVDDPVFRRVEMSGLAPGQQVELRLEGGAALEVEVVDADGAPLRGYELVGELLDTNVSPREFVLEPTEESADADVRVYPHVPATSLRLLVRREGVEPFAHELPPFLRGERRGVRIVVLEPTRLHGTVRDGSGVPVEGARVVLARPALEGDGDQTFYIDEEIARLSDDLRAKRRVEVAAAGSDERGAYSITGFFEGAFVLRASARGGASASVALDLHHGARDHEKDLAVPRPGRVEGHLHGAPEARLPEGFRLRFEPVAVELDAPRFQYEIAPDDDRPPIFDLDVDHAFAGELAAGRWRPTLTMYRPTGEAGWASTPFLAPPVDAEFVVRAGETTRYDLDVGEFWPATLEVLVTGDVAPRGCRVWSSDSIMATTDAGGLARLFPVRPGEHRPWLTAADSSWVVEVADPVVVAAGGTARVQVDVRTSQGTLTFVDEATREPLRGVELVLGAESREARTAGGGPFQTRLVFRTDTEGCVRASLTPWTYTVERRVAGRGLASTRVPLVWTPAGPDVTTVALPPEPDAAAASD